MENSPSNAWYASRLSCPDCRSELDFRGEFYLCNTCGFESSSIRDLRPRNPKSAQFSLPRSPVVDPETLYSTLEIENPTISYNGPAAHRDSSEFMSVMSELLPQSSAVLDLGCGPRDQAVPIEHLGHRYVGIDYCGENSDLLADAHALPFKDASFDCVFSYAVFEHLYNPFVALQEVTRVLKPGGVFIGGLSQGEPYHESYFHTTPWGLASLIYSVPGLELMRVWPSSDTLLALTRIGRYPRAIKTLIYQVHLIHQYFPFLAPRKLKWPRRDRMLDKLYRAGSLSFCVGKL